MNVSKIVEGYLQEHGFDGLVSEFGECGCVIGDLFPCGEPYVSCMPGYKIPCGCADQDCGWHIVTEKPGKEEVEDR